MSLAGYRAILDQEEMLELNKVKKLQKIVKMAKITCFVSLANFIATIWAKSILASETTSGMIVSLCSMIVKSSRMISFPLILIAAIAVFVIWKILKNSDKLKRALWGNQPPPQVYYRYDEYLDDFEVLLSFDGDENLSSVGRVEPNDEIAKNFKKTTDSEIS